MSSYSTFFFSLSPPPIALLLGCDMNMTRKRETSFFLFSKRGKRLENVEQKKNAQKYYMTIKHINFINNRYVTYTNLIFMIKHE